jgi:hypothetical protein
MKKSLSERDICTKFITPAIQKAGWDVGLQIREEVSFTKGRIIVRGRLVGRGKAKRADYILYYKPNIPLALGSLSFSGGGCVFLTVGIWALHLPLTEPGWLAVFLGSISVSMVTYLSFHFVFIRKRCSFFLENEIKRYHESCWF